MSAPNRDQRYRLPPETTLELLAPSKADQPVPLSRRIPPEKLFGGYGDDPRNPVQVASLRMKYAAEAPRRHYPPPPMGTAESPTPAQAHVVDSDSEGSDDPHEECVESDIVADIGLTEKELTLISTKKLNRLIKERGLSKKRAKEIKMNRRTLKNRGYAANCRIKRAAELETLQDDINKLKTEANIFKQDADDFLDELFHGDYNYPPEARQEALALLNGV